MAAKLQNHHKRITPDTHQNLPRATRVCISTWFLLDDADSPGTERRKRRNLLTNTPQDDPILRPPSLPRRGRDAATKPPVALTIAGFDPSSGAGITADLQTFAAHGLFGTSAITALTVQSTQSVAAIQPLPASTLRRTLNHLTADLPPAGVKIGMLGTLEIVREVADFLQEMDEDNADKPLIPFILDPVLQSSSGTWLIDAEGLEHLREHLLDRVSWITPNWRELALLSGAPVEDRPTAEWAMNLLGELHPHLNILATGGDQVAPTDLLRTSAGEIHAFSGNRVETTSTHGTGCAFSSALLSRFILGDTAHAAITAAKSYVEGALRHAPGLGSGRGPMDLLWPLRDNRHELIKHSHPIIQTKQRGFRWHT